MFDLSIHWLVTTLDASLKAVLLALLAVLVLRALRVNDSNLRHRVWTGVLLGMLTLPLASQVVPALQLPVAIDLGWIAEQREAERAAALANTESQASPPAVTAVEPAESIVAGPMIKPAESATGFPADTDSSVPSTAAWEQGFEFDGHYRPSADGVSRMDGGPSLADNLPSEVPTAAPDVIAAASTPVSSPPETLVRPAPPSWLQRQAARWPEWLFALWGVVAAVLTLRLLIALAASRWLLRSSTPIDPLELAELGLPTDTLLVGTRMIPLLECDRLRVPITLGLWRPRILLPLEWVEWRTDKLAAVLKHEMTHIERGDCAVMLLAELNRCVAWFHPLAWWLKRHLSVLAESACDDAVIGTTGDRTTYARHLLEVASVAARQRGRVMHTGVSMARRSNVETRIHSILDFTRPLSQQLTRATTLALLAIIIPVIALAAALRPAEEQASDRLDAVAQSGATTDPGGESPAEGETSATSDGDEESSEHSQPTVSSAHGQSSSPNAHRFHGQVVAPDGRPVADAEVRLARVSSTSRHAPGEATLLAEWITDDEGRFSGLVDRNRLPAVAVSPLGWPLEGLSLLAFADEYGVAIGRYDVLSGDALKLELVADEPVRGRVLDIDGCPRGGVAVEVVSMHLGSSHKLDEWMHTVETDESGELIAPVFGKSNSANLTSYQPLMNQIVRIAPNQFPTVQTDSEGRFELRGLGRDRQVELRVVQAELASSAISVLTRPTRPIRTRVSTLMGRGERLYGSEFEYIASPGLTVEGVVRDSDSGEPIAGIGVQSDRLGEWGGAEGYLSTTTDEEGRYRLHGLPLGKDNRLRIAGGDLPYLDESSIQVPASSTAREVACDIELKRGIWVTGRVTDEATGEPIPGRLHYTPFDDNPATSDYLPWSSGISTLIDYNAARPHGEWTAATA